MVGPGAALVEDAAAAAGIAQADRHFLGKQLARQQMGAAGDKPQSARRHQWRGQLRQLAIGAAARPEILAAFDEIRRIGDDDPEARAGLAQLLQRVEGLAFFETRDFRQAVLFCGIRRLRQRQVGTVDAQHAFRAGLRRRQGEGAGIAVAVQHLLAFRQRGQNGPGAGEVEIPAGLLPFQQIEGKAHAAFLDQRRFVERAGREPDVLLQTLQFAHGGIVAQHHRARLELGPQRIDQHGCEHLGAGRVDLQAEHVVVTIDHHARHAVGLGMHQSVIRGGKAAIPEHFCGLQPGAEEVCINARLGVARPQTRRDQRMGIEACDADTRTMSIEQPHQHTCRQCFRRGVEFQLVGVHPGMSTLHTALFARFHAQYGQRFRGHGQILCEWFISRYATRIARSESEDRRCSPCMTSCAGILFRSAA